MFPAEIEQQVIENSDYVQALERVLDEAKSLVNRPGCHAHDLVPCRDCLVGTDWRDLAEAVTEAELAR